MAFINMPRPVFQCQCGDHAWTVLTLGYITLVSAEDAHILSKSAWTSHKGRNTIYAKSKGRRLHQVIMKPQNGEKVDHRSGVGLDNRRPNLRAATNQQNCQNGPAHKDSTSKFRGVCWSRNYKMWRATIYVEGKQKHLGYFFNEDIAAGAYDCAAMQHFRDFARLNFPTGERDRSYEAFDHRVESPSALFLAAACAAFFSRSRNE